MITFRKLNEKEGDYGLRLLKVKRQDKGKIQYAS